MRQFLANLRIPPEKRAAEWQGHARDWYILGNKARGDVCHALAEYWGLPLLLRVFYVWKAMRLQKALDDSRHLDRVENIMQSIAKEVDDVEEDR